MPPLQVPLPFPQESKPTEETAGAVTGSSTATTITASGTANVMGSWTQVIASTTKRAVAIGVSLAWGSGVDVLVDVGTGASGAEVVLLPTLLHAGNGPRGTWYIFVIEVPAGTRIAARCQSSTGSATDKIAIHLMEEE